MCCTSPPPSSPLTLVKMAAATDRGVPLSTLCPKFLHTNSTSHTWPFSAIAELIDNAYDPDVNAKQFWIDKTLFQGEECLTFMDNGNGLNHNSMHKMLSFGYSDKTAVKGVEPIGIYGNGFKSGSMRLGRDAIVFSKSKTSSCVGMLSQTYLEKIDAQQISVPIVCFEQRGTEEFSAKEEHKASLQDILRYSPFTTKEDLITEFNAISHPFCTENTGTRIIIWNLRRTSNETGEFDFEKDRYDIQIPSDIYEEMNGTNQYPDKSKSYIPESVYSLRAYCSILYLKPRMQVIIRGQKVKSQLVAKSLAFIQKDHYKPTFLNKRIPITFGYNTKSKDQYGIMMYHKNRLIKAYERVGCQLKANNQGVGVIGVIECNYLDPTHNKQSFNETDKYRKTINNLGIKLEEYWKEIRYKRDKDHPNSTTAVEDIQKRPDQNWVQCDDCLRWRKLSDGIDISKLPEKWFCRMNPDPQFRSCQVDEEPEDSDEDQPSYRKTYKLQERQKKKQQEKKRQKDEEEQRRQEQCLAHLTKQTEALKRQLHQTTPSAPTTRESRPRRETLQGGSAKPASSPLSSSIISQATCSPSSYSGLPVISNVCSLSSGSLRVKRRQSITPQTTPKKPRTTSPTPSSVNVTPLCSPSVPVDSNDDVTDDTDDTDDDIFIVETNSTPKPKKLGFDLTKVKTEEQQSETNVNLLLECSEDAAVDDALVKDAAGTSSTGSPSVGTSPSIAPPPGVASITTQTEISKMKKEQDDQIQTDERVGQSTSKKDAQSVNHDEHASQNEVRQHLESNQAAGPFCADACDNKYSLSRDPVIIELQEQQDKLLELMQATALERDSFKEQVHKLTCQLQDMQNRVQELCQVNVKKECSSQASQTEETVGTERGENYQSLFENAKKKVDELIMEKENLLEAIETKSSSGPGREKDIGEVAFQVDRLLRELDQTKKEKDELRSQLDSVEEERANLAFQCEKLRLSLQQQRPNTQKENTRPQRVTDSSVQTNPEWAEGTANSV
ncbi:MORC family CW-type zinc finger protein 3a isoform X2 [Channa argus]|uniref:MORC family CW-type zinc finger protein 3a isoform X2 n=1 Tax=Channa argus TaxID=215402 RepID=UPI003520F355